MDLIIIDRLTKSVHFLPFRVGQSTEILADKYIREKSVCLEFQLALCRTETRDSGHISGKVSKRI